MPHKLPDLPYDKSALEPHIDTRTMAVHHDKHHQAYVDNLNRALEGYKDLQSKSVISLLLELDDLPEGIQTAVRNNGGGHLNHSLFWECMSPNGGGEPRGSLAEAIDEAFGSFGALQAAFGKAAATYFGSGWTWLAMDGEGQLVVATTPGHDVPLYEGMLPLLVLDVWEHAYYLRYENRRADYIAAWWNVVDWDRVSANYRTARVQVGLVAAAEWAKAGWELLEEQWEKLFKS